MYAGGVPCLILTPRLTNDSLALERAARELSWTVHRAVRYRLPPAAELEDPVVYGELVFCDVMAEKLGLGLLEPSHRWLAELPAGYLQRQVRALNHEDLYSVTERSFIKPSNDKLFEAGIFERGSHVPRRYIAPDLPVLVSEVVSFGFELRCYVLDRKLLTAGVYAFEDARISRTKERFLYESGCEWAQQLLGDPKVELPSAVVIDVGFIPELMTWAVVEANQAYCSGIYRGGFVSDDASPGADPRQVLRVVQRSGGLRTHVSLEDVKWLRPSYEELSDRRVGWGFDA